MKSSVLPRSPIATVPYRWLILALAALTFTLVMGMPSMALPVLFPEIAADLGLSIVQVGFVWGIASLTGIVMGLMGGIIGDTIGAKRTLVIACAFIGVTGALRGFANGYALLMITTFLYGLATPVIATIIHKVCGIWFPGRQLGMANGIVATGMALGFMLGSLLGATVLSPWLGGWRNVMFAFGIVAILFSAIWSMTRATPRADTTNNATTNEETTAATTAAIATPRRPPLWAGLRHVAQLRNVWLLGLTLFGLSGAIQGTLGYLPSYLRAVGWEPAPADSALASFHAMSMCAAIPFALLSDRLGKRRELLLVSAAMTGVGFALLVFASGPLVWVAVILAGLTRDGFMAIFMTQVLELKGVGVRYAGTATGFTVGCAMLGNVIAPPLGNSLEGLGLSLPFLLWAGMVLIALVGLASVRE